MSNDERDRPTSRPPPRAPMTKVTIYRDPEGKWTFDDAPGSISVEAEIAHGHRLNEGTDGRLWIVAEATPVAMSAEQAVRAGKLIIPIIQKK